MVVVMNNPIEVLITLPFPEDLVSQLRAVSPGLHFTVQKASQPEDISKEIWERIEVLYTNHVIPKLDQVPKLRWIQFHWAGVDHIIDHPILKKPGLVATTLSGAAVPQMAEYVLMMLLALGHQMPALADNQKRGEWPQDRWKRFIPQELSTSTVGIIGYGSIGRQVARLLHAFGATILAVKNDAKNPEDAGYIPLGIGDPTGDLPRRIYPTQAIKSVLKECDFVVVTVPLTPGTTKLIGEDEIAALKPTAFLVDTSRGGVIDHEALINALRERKIAGAALDVFPEEPLPADSPFWNFPNVFVTPHISGITPHYDQRAIALFAENLQRYVNGLDLYNIIDPSRGY